MQKGLLIFTLLILLGCERKVVDSDYFNGTVEVVDSSCAIIRLSAKEIEFDDIWVPNQFMIYDSLMIVWTPRSNKTLFQILNLNSKETLGNFCHMGRARNEMLATTPLSNLFVESGELKSYVLAFNEKRLMKWNISKSIETNSAIFDTIITKYGRSSERLYDFFAPMSDSILLCFSESCVIDRSNARPELPVVELRAIFSDTIYKSFNVFKNVFKYDKPHSKISSEDYNANYGYPHKRPEIFFASTTCIRPDGKYIAQAMFYMGQINIINVETGEIKGFRIKETPDFTVFANNAHNGDRYFSGGVWATNDRIFAGYDGRELNRERRGQVQHIYEFTWDGELVNIYDMGVEVSKIVHDPVSRKFYAISFSTEKLYVFDHDF